MEGNGEQTKTPKAFGSAWLAFTGVLVTLIGVAPLMAPFMGTVWDTIPFGMRLFVAGLPLTIAVVCLFLRRKSVRDSRVVRELMGVLWIVAAVLSLRGLQLAMRSPSHPIAEVWMLVAAVLPALWVVRSVVAWGTVMGGVVFLVNAILCVTPDVPGDIARHKTEYQLATVCIALMMLVPQVALAWRTANPTVPHRWVRAIGTLLLAALLFIATFLLWLLAHSGELAEAVNLAFLVSATPVALLMAREYGRPAAERPLALLGSLAFGLLALFCLLLTGQAFWCSQLFDAPSWVPVISLTVVGIVGWRLRTGEGFFLALAPACAIAACFDSVTAGVIALFAVELAGIAIGEWRDNRWMTAFGFLLMVFTALLGMLRGCSAPLLGAVLLPVGVALLVVALCRLFRR